MGIAYDDNAADTNDVNPKGHFSDPHADQNTLTIRYFAESPGPEYWICVVKVLEIVGDQIKIRILGRNGVLGTQSVTVDLNDLTRVWRNAPSTVKPAVGQGALAVNDFIVLCVTDAVLSGAQIKPGEEQFVKHPWGGDGVRAAIREMAALLGDKVDQLTNASKVKAKFPDLFK